MLRRIACSMVGLLTPSGPTTLSFSSCLPSVAPLLDSMKAK